MVGSSVKGRLFASSVIGGAALMATFAVAPASAQTPAAAEPQVVDEIVVTGSRIRRAETTTEAPVTVIDAQSISERGFVSPGQALNEMTAVVPSYPQADGSGASSGSGQQFPNLFGLGPGRTLTLVNGRRFVTSSQGLGDRVVDTNIIPTGLIERIDVVQAGGAAGLHHVDPLDQAGRDDVGVHHPVAQPLRGRHEAAAVHQGQRPARAEAEEVGELLTAARARPRTVSLRIGRDDRGHFVQRLTRGDEAALGNRLGVDDRHRRLGGRLGAPDARTGDDDLVHHLRLGRRRRLGAGRSHGEGRHQGRPANHAGGEQAPLH